MSMYPQSAAPVRRAQTLDAVAAALGGFSFLVAFLPFYTTGNNGISGYALGTPTSAAIGFSLFAGVVCALGLLPVRNGHPTSTHEQPLALAAGLTALLLAVANLVSKGNLSGDVSFGFVLFLLGLFVQAGLLLYLWLVGTGRMSPVGSPASGAQQYPSSAPAGQQYPGQTYSNKLPPNQPLPGQPYPGQLYPGAAGTSPQYPDQPYGPFYPPQR